MLVRFRERRVRSLPPGGPVSVEVGEREDFLSRLNPVITLPRGAIVVPFREADESNLATNVEVRLYRVVREGGGVRLVPMRRAFRFPAFVGWGVEAGVDVYDGGSLAQDEVAAFLVEYASDGEEGRVFAVVPSLLPEKLARELAEKLLDGAGVSREGSRSVKVWRLGVDTRSHPFLAFIFHTFTAAILPHYRPKPLSGDATYDCALFIYNGGKWEKARVLALDTLNPETLNDEVGIAALPDGTPCAVACFYQPHMYEEPRLFVLPLRMIPPAAVEELKRKVAKEFLFDEDEAGSVEFLSPG